MIFKSGNTSTGTQTHVHEFEESIKLLKKETIGIIIVLQVL